jgi:hypothetical protein
MNQVAAARVLAPVLEGVTTPQHEERMMKTLKAKGHIGSWFANVESFDERLPCAHAMFWQGGSYCDPTTKAPPDAANCPESKIVPYVDAIHRLGKVLVTKDVVLGVDANGHPRIKRRGYVGVFPK